MAGTILQTPALGSADWSTWITQQERTDRGFMRVSLTNFSATTASTIATGSVLECAGSIFQFTDTIIALASGTASANVAVYYVVIPSAGGTTCTIEMNSTAPVWVDAKQGFYASAASVSRAIGGCYIGTALVYYNKWLYEGDHLTSSLERGHTRPVLINIKEIAADYTIADGDGSSHYFITTGASDRTITLPTLADNIERSVFIMKADTGAGKVIIDGEGSEAINGTLTWELNGQYQYLHLIGMANEWKVLDHYGPVYRATDTTVRSQAASANVWYNLGSFNLAGVPVGTYQINYMVVAGVSIVASIGTTLSKTNNTEDDKKFTVTQYVSPADSTAMAVYRQTIVIVTTASTFYLNTRAGDIGTIYNENALSTAIIEATRIA